MAEDYVRVKSRRTAVRIWHKVSERHEHTIKAVCGQVFGLSQCEDSPPGALRCNNCERKRSLGSLSRPEPQTVRVW